jgi:hypothetical protein
MNWTWQTRAIALALALTAVLLPVVLVIDLAKAADMRDCRTYANRGSALALRQLLGFPFVDVAAGKFLYRKAYSFCLNADELPPMTFTPEEQPIIDDAIPTPREKPPGSVPATDAPSEDEQVRGNLPLAPSKKIVAGPAGQPLCIRHKMKTVYKGKSWRCRK